MSDPNVLDDPNVLFIANLLALSPTREQVAVALFNQLKTAGDTFLTYSRRPALWDNTVEMPCLYMGNTKEELTYSGDNYALALNAYYFNITIYFAAGLDPNVAPDIQLNNLLDAVDAALAPPPYQQDEQTLGSLVAYCRRDGEVLRVPGYLDGQGGAYFEVKVLVPS